MDTPIGDALKQNNLEEFIKAYGELVKKYNVDFAPIVELRPNKEGAWEIVTRNVPIDMSERNKKSWFK